MSADAEAGGADAGEPTGEHVEFPHDGVAHHGEHPTEKRSGGSPSESVDHGERDDPLVPTGCGFEGGGCAEVVNDEGDIDEIELTNDGVDGVSGVGEGELGLRGRAEAVPGASRVTQRYRSLSRTITSRHRIDHMPVVTNSNVGPVPTSV